MEGFKEFRKKFKTLTSELSETMDNATKDTAYFAIREMKKNLRDNESIYTGRLLNTLQAKRFFPLVWGVGSNVKYQWYLELGTRPHKPPLKPIWEWVRLKHKMYGKEGKQAAYPLAKAVQESIEARGTKPHPFIRPAYEAADREAKKIALKHLKKLRDKLKR